MKDCVFCEQFDKNRIVYEDDTWIAVYDSYPVSKGHTLLIPKRHCETFFDLNDVETGSLVTTINIVKSVKSPSSNWYDERLNCSILFLFKTNWACGLLHCWNPWFIFWINSRGSKPFILVIFFPSFDFIWLISSSSNNVYKYEGLPYIPFLVICYSTGDIKNICPNL